MPGLPAASRGSRVAKSSDGLEELGPERLFIWMEYIQNRDDLYSFEAGELFRGHYGVNALMTPHVEQIIIQKPTSMMIEVDALGGKCLRIKPSDLESWLARLPKNL